MEALEYAYRFASSLDVDPKDKGKAQELVVMDYAAKGDLAKAMELAGGVTGWRQGVVYAELASRLAGEGRTEEAGGLVARAEKIRQATEGWQGVRIEAHIAQALAVMGRTQRAGEMATQISNVDPQQYRGRAAATRAASLAAVGDFDGAMAQLRVLDPDPDFDVARWRTSGYLDLAGNEALSAEQRRQALEAARVSARGITGWQRLDSLQTVAFELQKQGEEELAVEVLEEAGSTISEMPGDLPVKVPLMAKQARGWAALGKDRRARELLTGAEKLIPAALVIDQPGLYAGLAVGYVKLDDGKNADRLFALALDAAEDLVNARPRALAVVSICRSMGLNDVALAAPTRERLDGLFAGLTDPW